LISRLYPAPGKSTTEGRIRKGESGKGESGRENPKTVDIGKDEESGELQAEILGLIKIYWLEI